MVNKSESFEPSILLVEDDPLTREQLGELLREYSRHLYLAENGEQGLKIYKETKPDIVITDILMPLMNGLDMARRIREINPLVQLIIITAYSGIDEFCDSKQTVHYVWKPVDIDQLFDVISKCKEQVVAG